MSIANLPDRRIAFADLIVRLVNEWIVIEDDRNNKPLVDALVQKGGPRERIVLAYMGESLPEEAAV